MKNQLSAGTYCVFATADKCRKAFKRARKLGLKIVSDFDGDETYLHFDANCHIISLWAGLGRQEITTTEFLARMEGTWEQPIEQLTLPQAIAKLEAEGWRLQEGNYLFKQEKDWFCYCRMYDGIWCVEFFENDSYLEPRQFPTAPEQLQAAINACNTLNNAKP